MPYVNKPRPYKKEYDTYQGKPEQIKNRAKRNAARAELAKQGMLIQVSGCSLVGTQGKKAKQAAIKYLEKGLVDIIASDAHSYNYRLEEFKQGLEVAESIVGKDEVYRMAVTNSRSIINDELIKNF